MSKLHLGSGKVYISGYINIDSDIDSRADIYDDIVTLDKITKEVDEIYACNCLEHFGKFRYKNALKRWYELLREGGILRISVPDFEAICDYYCRTKDLDSLYSALYAGQDSEWNFHYWCWDFEHLKKDLKEIGFKDIKRFTPFVKDWSINYVPYLDPEGNELPDEDWFTGTAIALNVEAVK